MKTGKGILINLLAYALALIMIFSCFDMTAFAAYETKGDPMVFMTQRWLNQEYGGVNGFGTVAEDGVTGLGTVYGLLRALQHELGITSLANSFGTKTSTLYNQNILSRRDGVKDNKFAILQGALWCKGYNPGYNISMSSTTGIVTFDAVFDSGVEAAVISLKKDAGFTAPDGTVTLNVMKALMSMTSFKLLSTSYGARAEVRAMQQRLNRKYESYTGLIPCDGVYGSAISRALIFAFQAEEGLPVGVANGSFGPTTKSLCPEIPYTADANAAKSYQNTYYTDAQISAFTELLQFSLFLNGFGDGSCDGVFDAETQQSLIEFQQHYALPVTGKAGLSTWMSLFLSSGDPDRAAEAADCVTILTAAKAQTLYDKGYRYVGRYLTGTYGGGISKAITAEEADTIFAAGLRFFPIYQFGGGALAYFTQEQGTSDARAAIAAAEALGLPADTVIYFAVDFDAMDTQVTSHVLPYFRKVDEEMSRSVYKTGIYGARNVCSRVAAAGYSCSSFVADMSTGFSGNLGYKIPDDWAFSQFANLEGEKALGTGDGRIEIDKNAFSGRDQCVSYLVGANGSPVSSTRVGFEDNSAGAFSFLPALPAAGQRVEVTVDWSKLSGKTLKGGMLRYSCKRDGKTVKAPLHRRVGSVVFDEFADENDEISFNKFFFIMPEENVTVGASFLNTSVIDSAAAAESYTEIFNVGAEDSDGGKALRFDTRMHRVAEIGGVKYTLKSCGTYIARADGGSSVHLPCKTLTDRSAAHVDFSAKITGISTGQLADSEYTAIAYGKYKSDAGHTVILYTAQRSGKYNGSTAQSK